MFPDTGLPRKSGNRLTVNTLSFVGNSPGEKSFVSMATDGMVTYDENGIARVTIPAAAGNFVKATVDFKPAERKLLGRQ